MPKIIINNAKWKVNADGDLEVTFDEPVVVVPPVVKPVVDFKWLGGFEKDDATQQKIHGETFVIQSPKKSHSVMKADAEYPIYRFTVNSNENWSGDKNNKDRERSEMYLKGANFARDKDIWITYSFRLPEEGARLIDKSKEFIYLGQAHASEDKGDVASNAVFGFLFDGKDEFEIVTSSATEKIHTVKPKAASRGKFKVVRGEWTNIVMRVRFSPTNGQFQLWKNGKEVVNLKNIGIGYNDTTGPYWKFGVYRTPMSNKITVDYANMEVGKNESLESRINNPLPIK